MNSRRFCPYCGSPLAGDGRYCDACHAELLPQETLSEDQLGAFGHLPYNGIVWGFICASISAFLACSARMLILTPHTWQAVLCSVAVSAFLATAIAAAGYRIVKWLFGLVAARPLKPVMEYAGMVAAAAAFWPLLGLVLAAL